MTCDKCNGTGEVTHPEGGPQYECSDCSGFMDRIAPDEYAARFVTRGEYRGITYYEDASTISNETAVAEIERLRSALEFIARVQEPFLESTAYLMWHKAMEALALSQAVSGSDGS